MPRVALRIAVLAAFCFIGLAIHGGSVDAQTVEPEHVAGELILVFRAGMSEAEISAFYASYVGEGVSEKENLVFSPDYRDRAIRLASVPVEGTVAMRDRLGADVRVELAELNYIRRIDATPNDPSYSSLWGMNNTGQTGGTADADIDAPEAWDISTGSIDQIAFVIDTGADLDHPDLAANLWVNPGETVNGADDDGNGVIDDIYGLNAILNNGNPEDDNNHGSHVSGTMGAVGNNSTGVVGVNWTTRIGQCKAFNAGGRGEDADILQCLLYVNDLKALRGQDIRVTNNSYGGGGFNAAILDAMLGVDQPGMAPILHVAAAGNFNINNDISPFYPASYTAANILSVAASDHNDLYANFTHYGSTSVDIAAPGVSVRSAIRSGGYANFSGTSMASPHVAGCADLLLSVNEALSATELKALIMDQGDALPAQSKVTVTNDRLNCFRSLAAAVPVELVEADLSIEKTESPDPVVAGEFLSYIVTATNNGPADAPSGITITDTLPNGARFQTAGASDGGTCPTTPPVNAIGGTIVCTWTDPVPNGATRVVNVRVRVCEDTGCGDLTNTAEVGLNPGAGGPITLWGATSTDMSTLYRVNPTTAAAALVGTIGHQNVTGLTVLPDGRLVGSAHDEDGNGGGPEVKASSSAPNGVLVNSSTLVDINRISAAGTLIGAISMEGDSGCARMPDLTWDGSTETLYGYGDRCDDDLEGLFTINTTTGAGTSVGPSGYRSGGNGLAWDFTTNTLLGTPRDNQSLVIFNRGTGVGSDLPGSVGNVARTINALAIHPVTGSLYGVWKNEGDDREGGEGLDAVSNLAPDGIAQGTTWHLILIDKETGDLTEIGMLPSSFDAIVFEGGDVIDPEPLNDTVTIMTAVEAESDLAVSKVDDPDPVVAGNTLVYTVTVDNLGPSNSDGTVLTDTLDALVSYVSSSVTPAGPSCVHSGEGQGGEVVCDLGTMGVAEGSCFDEGGSPDQYVVEITVLVSELAPCSPNQCPGSEAFGAAPLQNVAEVQGANCLPDPVPGNNTDTEQTEVLAGADVLIAPPGLEKFAESPAFSLAGGSSTVKGEGGSSAHVTTTVMRVASDAPDYRLMQDPDECLSVGDVILVTQVFSNTGPMAFTTQRDNRGPEFESVHPTQVDGLLGTCEILEGGGTCSLNEARAQWNGEIPVGGRVTLQYRVRIKGGLPFGQIITFIGKMNYDEFNVGINTAMRSAETEIAIDCAPTVHPNTQLGCQVHLPILNFLGQDDLCETWIEVQHLGCDFAKASLVTWGEPGFCPPQAAGPLKVECTGLLKPGATWNMLGAQIPNGSKSGILFKWTAKQLSEIGVDLGFDDVVADYMCETLFFGVVGDADDYRRFKKAYNEGLEFGGVPMDLATGGGALAVDVHRTCPGDVTPGVEVTSKYNGIAGTHLGVYDPVYGGYGYYVPLVYADKVGFTSIMYVQNGGLECTSVEVWFQEQDNCLRATICDIATLAPGETYQLDANDCVGPDFQGSAWLRTSQPTGIAVDIVGRDILMTYIGEPAEINYTFDPADAFFTGGNQVGFAPLIYSEYQGWDSGLQVQNLSGVTAAKVKVYFMDRSGDIITTLVDWVCPRGSQTFFLPVIADLPGNWTGSARVESQEWLAASGPRVDPPNIVAIATLIKYDDAARTNAVEAIAYNLLPEHKIYDWQIGYRTGGNLESGVGLVAIPSLLKDVGGSGLTSEIAIANVVPKPGFTDFAIYVYDQNGLLDYICQKLGAKQVEYIDLQTWGYVNPGFKGSAIISAIFWEHDVHDSTGRFVRNLVGLGAVAIERNSTRLGMDVPGDEAAGSRGIPFAQGISEGDEFEFCPMGELPICPGVPLVRPDPDLCPAEATFDCFNCPLSIPATGTSGMMDTALVDVDISAACTILDVDVTLNLNHTFLGDLVVSVTSPEGTPSTLFTQICGGSDDIMAIVDDDAPTPIGSVCSPLGSTRYTTQSGVGLDLFDGESAAGVWRLDINDLLGGDSGMLNNWSVTVQTR